MCLGWLEVLLLSLFRGSSGVRKCSARKLLLICGSLLIGRPWKLAVTLWVRNTAGELMLLRSALPTTPSLLLRAAMLCWRAEKLPLDTRDLLQVCPTENLGGSESDKRCWILSIIKQLMLLNLRFSQCLKYAWSTIKSQENIKVYKKVIWFFNQRSFKYLVLMYFPISQRS